MRKKLPTNQCVNHVNLHHKTKTSEPISLQKFRKKKKKKKIKIKTRPWISTSRVLTKNTSLNDTVFIAIIALCFSNGFDLRHLFILAVSQTTQATPQTSSFAPARLVEFPDSLIQTQRSEPESLPDSVRGAGDLC